MGSRVELFEQIRRDRDREELVDAGVGGAVWGSPGDGQAGAGVAGAAGTQAAGGSPGAEAG